VLLLPNGVAPGAGAGLRRLIPQCILVIIGRFAGNAGRPLFVNRSNVSLKTHQIRMTLDGKSCANIFLQNRAMTTVRKRVKGKHRRRKRGNAGRPIDPAMLFHNMATCPICASFITAILSFLYETPIPNHQDETNVVPFRLRPTDRN
jgi:hypothetical protein